MDNKDYFMYVLLCGDGSFYCGYTDDVSKRLKKHQSGKGAKYTKNHAPVDLLFYEKFTTKSLAMKAEYQFKHQTRQKKEAYLLKNGISSDMWTF
ncbi:GIY-YIG nuclease family protein [Lactobacillus sp. S2-2]|uniref:GIY-YIG nuclease family protein n=1 Tax=Lactobacillus sp. S2-2 TaxID=2692917 RepID=UPI001F18B73C|nr:GIY-YIG nuclease family protein [Lactobacillus sp. S2-2]MCF6514936.1 GIY-YIG nuclease family protein [Lactobacillus sp. S2-2]